MRFEIPFNYTEEIIPYRCRKPRRVGFSGRVECEVREVTADQAPLVVIEQRRLAPKKIEYRVLDGLFYAPICTQDRFRRYNQKTKRVSCPRKLDVSKWEFQPQDRWYEDEQTARRQIAEWYERFLIVDGSLHISVGEPRWVIHTFGLGHNHGLGGGTSLSVTNGYNSNITNQRYFRLDKQDEAVRVAAEIAANRGDTNALPMKPFEKVTILDPSVLTVDPLRQHGTGDPFINKIEGVISGSPDATFAGLGALAVLAQELG